MAFPENPYQILIDSCNDDALAIQEAYQTHRLTRSRAQISKFLDPDFKGVEVDPVLYSLVHDTPPGFQDPRNCLVFWARPTKEIKVLIGELQKRLRAAIPELYCPKVEDLHLTALEITHSLTAEEIDLLVIALMPQVERMVNLPRAKGGARLGRPMISFDAQALALSFLPLAGGEGDEYGYHHLRRDLWDLAREKVKVASRYVVPSAHITLGRFLGREVDAKEVVRVVEDINGWLESDFGGEHGEWIVGREVGLCFRKGRVWYGGGESVCIGEGI